jgi:hypothetical protein
MERLPLLPAFPRYRLPALEKKSALDETKDPLVSSQDSSICGFSRFKPLKRTKNDGIDRENAERYPLVN